MATGFIVQSAHHTDAGRTRGANEDNALVLEPSDDQLSRTKGRLFIVADGMGGSNRGDLASQLAVQRISDSYYSNPNDDPLTCIRESFQQANLAICEADRQAGIQNDKGYGLGTTCVAAVLREKTLYVANVGDSRAYVLRDGQLRQITRDHSLVAQLIERGEITPAEARTHEQRHLIYRALGMPDVEVACFIEAVQEGDTLLLCTDGLSNQVGDEEIRAIIEQYGPEESVQRLIACANERGGLDNITAVVVRIAAA